MRGRTVALLAALLSFAATGRADSVEATVAKLAAPRYAEREKAARDLEALGEPALKALKAAQGSADEEVRARARILVDKIELAERSRRLLEAPKLSLMFPDYPLDTAVQEFARQSGIRVAYNPGPGADAKRKISLDTGSLPYWEAVHAFYKAAGLTEDGPPPEPLEKKMVITSGARMQVVRSGLRPRSTAVPYAVRLTEGEPTAAAVRDRALRVRALPATFPGNKYDDVKGELTVHLDVDPAPTLNLQGVLGIQVRHAAAEDGRVLAAAHPEAEPVAPLDYDFRRIQQQLMIIEDGMIQPQTPDSQVPVVLKSGGLRPKVLTELSGVVVARVLAPPEPLLQIDRVLDAKGQTVSADNRTLTVVSVEDRPGNRVAVRARITTRTVQEELNFPVIIKGQARNFINIVREVEMPAGVKGFQIRTADGKAVADATTTLVRGTSTGDTSANEVQILFAKPDAKAGPVALAYTARRSVVVELPFTLKDVPVP